MYRLHIDVPLGDDVLAARISANKILDCLTPLKERYNIQYRLGNDADRQKSNYMQINENGHCSNKKSIL